MGGGGRGEGVGCVGVRGDVAFSSGEWDGGVVFFFLFIVGRDKVGEGGFGFG